MLCHCGFLSLDPNEAVVRIILRYIKPQALSVNNGMAVFYYSPIGHQLLGSLSFVGFRLAEFILRTFCPVCNN